MEGLQLSIPRRMQLLKSVGCFALTLSMLFTLRLWGGERDFPTTPVVSLPVLKQGFDLVFPVLAMILLVASVFLRAERILLAAGLLVFAYLLCLDITRVQVWSYLYFSILVVFVFYNGRVDDPNRYTSYFIILQFVIAGFYFYSGLHQFNSGFEGVFTELVRPLEGRLSERQFGLLTRISILSPFFFIFTGLALVVSPLRYLGISVSILLHCSVILLRALSGKYEPASNYLFNLVMMLIILLLFSGRTKQRYFSPMFLFQNFFFYLAMALYLALPFVHLYGRWPEQLSWNYHSGNVSTGKIYFDEAVFEKLPGYVQLFCTKEGSRYTVDHAKWCLYELHAQLPPSEEILKSVALSFERAMPVKETELEMEPYRPLLLKP